jgi:hypothetical protein
MLAAVSAAVPMPFFGIYRITRALLIVVKKTSSKTKNSASGPTKTVSAMPVNFR